MLVLIKSILTKTVESAEQLEEELQLPVQAVIPHSRKQKQMEKARQKSLNTFGTALTAPLILAKQSVDDISIESLRSLRMSLQMMAAGSSHRIIATLGSLSNIGKSFVSLNLAQVIADTGKRTLLIDADVRKGRLHHALLQSKSNGLSEYLEGKCSYENLVRSIDHGFFYIPCGSCTQHPIGLFESQRFQDLIAKVRQEFDQVIIDTPPILSVADSIVIAKHCDIKLFVVSAGKDLISDVRQAVKKARSHGIQISGFVLNHRRSLLTYGANSYYRYAYTAATT